MTGFILVQYYQQMQRLAPSFFIIGERKCATSALYRYLLDHPAVLPCAVKEPQYFSKSWWYRFTHSGQYRRLYPARDALQADIEWFELTKQGRAYSTTLTIHRDPDTVPITGEASANTFAQVPPERLKKAYPQAKLILSLRHPVDRAFAHYKMLLRFAMEGRRLPIVLHDFKSDFVRDFRAGANGIFAPVSLYTERLKAWTAVFGEEAICIVRSEDLRDKTTAQNVMNTCGKFLGLGKHDYADVLNIPVNISGSEHLDADLRSELFEYYQRDISHLEAFTGRKFHWE